MYVRTGCRHWLPPSSPATTPCNQHTQVMPRTRSLSRCGKRSSLVACQAASAPPLPTRQVRVHTCLCALIHKTGSTTNTSTPPRLCLPPTTDLVKVRLQAIDPATMKPYYNYPSPWTAIWDIYKHEGGLRALYRCAAGCSRCCRLRDVFAVQRLC